MVKIPNLVNIFKRSAESQSNPKVSVHMSAPNASDGPHRGFIRRRAVCPVRIIGRTCMTIQRILKSV